MAVGPRLAITAVAAGSAAVCGTLALGVAPALAAPDICVATNGAVRHQSGTAECSAHEYAGNVAIAKGADSSAVVGPAVRSRAMALGDGSAAVIEYSNVTTARATGTDSSALSYAGNDQIVIASGDGSTAWTNYSSGQTLLATTDGCTIDLEHQPAGLYTC